MAYLLISICVLIYGYLVYEKEQQKDNNNRDLSLLWTAYAFISIGALYAFQSFLMTLTSPDRYYSFLRFVFAEDLVKLVFKFIK
jgi:hypothetical protein